MTVLVLIKKIKWSNYRWNFKSEKYDIAFELKHNNEDLFENRRADSHVRTQKGTYFCKEPGVCKWSFDQCRTVLWTSGHFC